MAIRISHFSSYTLRFNINQLQLIHNSCCCHIFNKLHYIVYIHLLPFLLRSRPIWILASPKDVKVSCSSSIFCVIPVILKNEVFYYLRNRVKITLLKTILVTPHLVEDVRILQIREESCHYLNTMMKRKDCNCDTFETEGKIVGNDNRVLDFFFINYLIVNTQ